MAAILADRPVKNGQLAKIAPRKKIRRVSRKGWINYIEELG